MRALSILLLIAGCHRDGGPAAPVSTADQDALWKLAPDGTVLGIVASPRALAMTEHAWGDVRAFMGATPELAPMLVKIGAVLGTPDLTFASVGLSATKAAHCSSSGRRRPSRSCRSATATSSSRPCTA